MVLKAFLQYSLIFMMPCFSCLRSVQVVSTNARSSNWARNVKTNKQFERLKFRGSQTVKVYIPFRDHSIQIICNVLNSLCLGAELIAPTIEETFSGH